MSSFRCSKHRASECYFTLSDDTWKHNLIKFDCWCSTYKANPPVGSGVVLLKRSFYSVWSQRAVKTSLTDILLISAGTRRPFTSESLLWSLPRPVLRATLFTANRIFTSLPPVSLTFSNNTSAPSLGLFSRIYPE